MSDGEKDTTWYGWWAQFGNVAAMTRGRRLVNGYLVTPLVLRHKDDYRGGTKSANAGALV
jgi:hypothetical protein